MLDAKVKNTVKNMIIGSAIYNVVLLIIVAIASYLITKKFQVVLINIVGVVLGFAWSAINIYLIAVALDKALSANDTDYAKRHVTFITTLRMIIFCVILVILFKYILGFSGGILFAVATLGTKVGSYLAPIIDNKLSKKG